MRSKSKISARVSDTSDVTCSDFYFQDENGSLFWFDSNADRFCDIMIDDMSQKYKKKPLKDKIFGVCDVVFDTVDERPGSNPYVYKVSHLNGRAGYVYMDLGRVYMRKPSRKGGRYEKEITFYLLSPNSIKIPKEIREMVEREYDK